MIDMGYYCTCISLTLEETKSRTAFSTERAPPLPSKVQRAWVKRIGGASTHSDEQSTAARHQASKHTQRRANTTARIEQSSKQDKQYELASKLPITSMKTSKSSNLTNRKINRARELSDQSRASKANLQP